MITQYPVGLIARTRYFRVLKTVWNNQDVKDFVLERMKASSNNIKPIIIIDNSTKQTTAEIPNEALTGFETAILSTELLLDMRKVRAVADWCINKVRIQNSTLTVAEKERACDIYEKRDYLHRTLNTREDTDLTDIENKLSL